jgi:thiol-disulfide isomerase/thioredoxin
LAAPFADWKLLQDNQVDTTALASSEAVAIFVGNGSNDAVYVMPKLAAAFKALEGRLAVVYLPCNVTNEAVEAKFVSSMPTASGWTIVAPSVAATVLAAMADVDQDDVLTLVLSNDATRVLNKDASRVVYQYQQDGFPWSPEGLAEAKRLAQEKAAAQRAKVEAFKTANLNTPGLKFLANATLIGQDKKEIPGSAVDYLQAQNNDVVALYFSAHWCGPCRGFTPKLAEVYNTLKAEGKKMEIVFVSSDSDQAAFDSYFGEMPWLALQYAQRDLKATLGGAFDCEGIPHLCLVDTKTGAVNLEGRAAVSLGAEYFPWTPEQVAQGKAEAAAKKAKEEAEAKAAAVKVVQGFRDAGTVVVQNHIYKAQVAADYLVTFKNFATVSAPEVKCTGKFFYEVEVVKVNGIVQMGWMTEGFLSPTEGYRGSGVGDDASSWGVDGVRQCLWPNSSSGFGSEWKTGDVIGFAANLEDKTLSFSVNGSFASPDGVAFSDIKAEWLAPALTGSDGQYRVNFGDQPFKFAPPDASYVSVHSLQASSGPQCEGGVCPV